MSGRREEERNEKIIRGLMKLPPNRRCINCNALGPQYVCTTFWTFVCMTCSGIHREFTHRVKSVSMSKFTSQEVEALQNGGNQRAREMYLNGWDLHGHRLPNNSNVEKIREFIKNVYVDKKYAIGKSSDKPPRDLSNERSHGEETRRASSYHSYSQSPPYDFQYEERRYGKHALALTRKMSDRGLYEGKFSSFLSPSRLSDQPYEDRFSNEGSNPRMSDYSVSSRGDPFRSNTQSPNFQKEIGSPINEASRDISAENLQSYTGKDGVKVLRAQRTMSSGSFGSFDSNSMSFKSINSAGLMEIALEPEEFVESHNKEFSTLSSVSQPSGSSDAVDIFGASFAPQDVNYIASASEASQLPESSSTPSLNLFQPPPSLTTPTFSAHQATQGPATASLDLFPNMPQQFPISTVDKKPADAVSPQNGGWATFDTQSVTQTGSETLMVPSSHGNSVGEFGSLSNAQWSSFEDSATHRSPPSSSTGLWQQGPQNNLSSFNTTTQWSPFPDISANGPSSLTPTVWNESQHLVASTIGTQSWNAFDDSTGKLPTHSTQTSSEQVEMQYPSVVNHHMDFGVPKEEGRLHGTDRMSTNPFDLPYETEADSSNMAQLWDMSSLQAALANGEMPVSFAGGVNQPWFSPSPATPYVPNGPQDALGLMSSAPGSQIQKIQTQGPVASIGGNPFA